MLRVVFFPNGLAALGGTEPKDSGWDAKGYLGRGIQAPLRVLKTHEVNTRRHRRGQGWIREKETHHWEWVTTLPAARLSTRLLWQIGHSGGRLRTISSIPWPPTGPWSCFKHDPTASSILF